MITAHIFVDHNGDSYMWGPCGRDGCGKKWYEHEEYRIEGRVKRTAETLSEEAK